MLLGPVGAAATVLKTRASEKELKEIAFEMHDIMNKLLQNKTGKQKPESTP